MNNQFAVISLGLFGSALCENCSGRMPKYWPSTSARARPTR